MVHERFRGRAELLSGDVADRAHELRDWDDVHKLTVRVDRLRNWHRPGLLCIGDAAHAMSPAGGVGVNLAVQDAVATANLLGPKLLARSLSDGDLARVQARRELPVRLTQLFQVAMLRDLYPRHLDDDTATHVPPVFRAFRALPFLRRIAGRFIGLGFRPEHVADPEPAAQR